MEKTTRAKKSANATSATKGSKSGSSKAKDSKTMLEEFFVDQLRDILWAEKALVKALPKMQKAATSEELASAFENHKVQTEEQVARLEEVFGLFDETARAKKCEAMEGLVKEGESIVEDTEDGSATRDVGLIMAAQKIEHYEIATYGGLVQLAKTIGRDDAAEILEQTLAEEKETDELLTTIAENSSNMEASAEDEEE